MLTLRGWQPLSAINQSDSLRYPQTMPQQGHSSNSSQRWKNRNKKTWWNIHISTASHFISMCGVVGKIMLEENTRTSTRNKSHIEKSVFLLYGMRITVADIATPCQRAWVGAGSHTACMHLHIDSCRHYILWSPVKVWNDALCHGNHLKHLFQSVTALFGLWSNPTMSILGGTAV